MPQTHERVYECVNCGNSFYREQTVPCDIEANGPEDDRICTRDRFISDFAYLADIHPLEMAVRLSSKRKRGDDPCDFEDIMKEAKCQWT